MSQKVSFTYLDFFKVLGLIAIPILINTVSGDVQERLEKQLGPNFEKYVYAVLIILTAYYFWQLYQRNKQIISEANKTSLLNVENRLILINGTISRYQKRLQQKLEDKPNLEIELALQYQMPNHQDKTHRALIIKAKKSAEVDSYKTLFTTYYNHVKRLLILGEPGSGKTVMLLNLANRLLDKAKQDSKHPIPVIINLASWRNEEDSFAVWLEKQLVYAAAEAGISKQFAQQIVESHHLLPLLDGLDEIPADHRDGCLIALKDYLSHTQSARPFADQYPEVIVCSRIAEHQALSEIAPFYGIVQIKTLSKKTITAYLNDLFLSYHLEYAGRLKQDFNHRTNPFGQSLQSAFFLQLTLALYQDGWSVMDLKENERQDLTASLLELYLSREFKKIDDDYPTAKARKYLSFIAFRLQENKKNINFELADLKEEWLGYKDWINRVLNRSVFGLLGGIAGVIIYIFFGGIGARFGLDLHQRIWMGLFFGIWVGIAFRAIQPDFEDTINWKSPSAKTIIEIGLVGIGSSILGGLTIGLIGSLFGLQKLGIYMGMITLPLSGILIWLLVFYKKSIPFAKLEHPYQRIFANAFTYLLMFALIISLGGFLLNTAVSIAETNSFDLIIQFDWVKIIGNLFAGIFLGFLAHPLSNFFAVFGLLCLQGSLPWRIVQFLNSLSINPQNGLMEQDGGQWRFRHQLIQDQLAAEWKAQKKGFA